MKKIKTFIPLIVLSLFLSMQSGDINAQSPSVKPDASIRIEQVRKQNAQTAEIFFTNGQKMILDFYGENIFRMYQNNNLNVLADPQADPPARILVENSRKSIGKLEITTDNASVSILTNRIKLVFDKETTCFTISDLLTGKTVVQSTSPVSFEKNEVKLTLKEHPDEYFFGGGVQNGRFSHKGKTIAIENQNSWTDGGVASPTPFYWSTNGYGMMWYTFRPGVYDFGRKEKNTVQLTHKTDYLDVFFMVNKETTGLLNDFYQLTGNPVLIPKFGFYEGHLNAYNRDYWKEDAGGILFEDGKRYRESQKDNGGVKESLNGELNNYQFSARAVIDRYKQHDMPLGWILPNDGYGAGYGQTETLEGNIGNLKNFGDYARKNGVEIGLWTQSDLHPKEGVEPLLQRDIVNEVGVAGVKVLKTDVAWVGAGYSFGLNGVQDVASIMPKYGNFARPFIISLDGWAGTQHYATIWSGDQTGGVWEYIRFHIPTYIGSGLSGQPNICSDMDGIFGGKNPVVNIRDYQWKTFTPMMLNMDGWGSNEKYPHALGEPAASLNRNYLKLKSELLPYAYSVSREAIDGLPVIRAMFLEEQNLFTLGINTQYQFMFGPNFLVAPIYQNTRADEQGNDLRNNIYLPEGEWIDYFSGQKYEGGRIINNFESPIWKLPVFVRNGAIIPMTNPNNNPTEIDKSHRIYEIYPHGNTSFTEYDDDGETTAYLSGKFVETQINSSVSKNQATITIQPLKGDFKGFVKEKTTEMKVNVTAKPTGIAAKVGNRKVRLKNARTMQEYNSATNVYFYDAAPDFNRFATKDSEFARVKIIRNPQLLVKIGKTDVSVNDVKLIIKGFEFEPTNPLLQHAGKLTPPQNIAVSDSNATAYTLRPEWSAVPGADYYELEFGGMLYSTIRENSLLFENLTPETRYAFKARAVNKSGASEWTGFEATTKSDPLQFAIRGIKAQSNVEMQGGEGLRRLFDFDEGNMMHTKYGENAVPFDLTLDLNSVNQLDKLEYLPRTSGQNGMFEKGKILFSNDKQTWIEAGEFEWKRNGENKTFVFEKQPVARYIKISVEKSVGNFGSGREIYIFKVPGTESYLPGDINNDKLIDSNDLTSYLNYTGLRLGDSDFEGYVSRGDVNKNNLIDAYDISNVAVRMDEAESDEDNGIVEGTLLLTADKKNYREGETVEITVRGQNLKSVNALSFSLPYNNNNYEFTGIRILNTGEMQNFTNDRLHSDGEKVLYPTFINVGNQKTLEGNADLFVIRLKAKRALKFELTPQKGLLVGKNLSSLAF